jgi:hypothetical protein
MLGRRGAVLTAYATLLVRELIALPPKVLKFFVKLTSSSQNKPMPNMISVAKDLAHLHRAYQQHLLPLTNVALIHNWTLKDLQPDEAADAVRSRLRHLSGFWNPLLTLANKHDLSLDPDLHENGHDPKQTAATPRLHTIPQAASIGLTRATASSRTAPTGICS